MNRRWVLTLALASLAVSVGAYYESEPSRAPVRFETLRATRGDVVATVACTGTLQAMKTVDVATQADGVVKELNADFNSMVHQGDVVARLDSSMIEAQVAQSRAALERAQADAEQLRITQDYAARDLARAEALRAKAVLDEADLETARVAAAQARADVEAAEARVAQARATVDSYLVDLDHTVIRAPIAGIVIARNVEVGQTVVSRLQAQTLFQIAGDLTKLRLEADVDESDVAQVSPGDPVRFTVDAYPGQTFTATVTQVRVNPNIDQNVVSYTTVVDVANPTLKLRPGMTANVAIEVGTRGNVLRVPAGALRFRPNDELFALLHQTVPAAAHASPIATSRRGAAAEASAHQKQVWVLRNGRLLAVPVRVGLSDGTYTEIAGARLSEGDQVVTNAVVTR